MYIGDYTLCEATVNRVKQSSLYDHYVKTHLMRVRRDPRLSTEERWQVTVHSLKRLGKRYGFGKAMVVWWQSFYGFWKGNKGFIFLPGKTVVCSSLFAEAYSSATSRTMGNTDHNIPTPAFLSHTNFLQDIQTTWRCID